MTLGGFLVRVALIALVVIWTIPTFGLFISSFRNPDLLPISGWWTSLGTAVRTQAARTGTADDQIQQEDGTYVITGNVLEEGGGSVRAFGLTANNPVAFQVGDVAELDNGGTLSISEDGTYTLQSPQPFEMDRGQRIYYEAALPPSFTLANYEQVLTSEGIDQSFINTFTVTIPATIIPIAIAAFAAYAFSWMEFRGRQVLFAVVVGLLVVPLQMSLIPLLRMYNSVSQTLPFFEAKSYPGIWLAHTGFGLPLAIFLLRNYIGGLPRELIESAKIDGASHFQIFTRLVLPLSVPALASFAIFQFLWVWNDLLVALVFLTKDADQIVLTSKLRELLGSRGDNWEILTASAFVSIIVPLIVFFSLQRYFVRGLLAGSVKGG
ncbi:MAG: carbohydrate ABC transporter permease [Anaerolineae bacterium]|nr:carbohydrate ABC transporter permease [Anaerolineae bacterium]